ncbi:MAG: 2-aminoethylphosphonate aminotransferase [Gammaproteobacteria bacterium]
MILLNPGPVTLSRSVREALNKPDLCHREPEFGELQASIRRGLLSVYGLPNDDWAAVLLAGSGTAAVEAMLTSLAPRDRKLLVIENGVYGERMAAIASAHGIDHCALAHPWGSRVEIDKINEMLDGQPEISHVAVVHHETTTGRLNDLAALGELCRARGVRLLVDAVSSFGAEALDFERWGIAACAATANKCLHGAPGVSFVVLRRDQLSTAAARTLYLDLANYCREQDQGGTPFTQPVHVFYALDQALAEFEAQGGRPARHQRYRALAQKIRHGLSDLGIEPLLAEDEASVVLSAYRLPAGLSYETLHDALKARGFIIYAGQDGLAKTIFRVAVMGAITDTDIDRLVSAFRAVLRSEP